MPWWSIPVKPWDFEKYWVPDTYIVEDEEYLKRVRDNISRELRRLSREELKAWREQLIHPTPENIRRWEELRDRLLRLENLRRRISYRYLRRERVIERELKPPYRKGVFDDAFDILTEIIEDSDLKEFDIRIKPLTRYWEPVVGFTDREISGLRLKEYRRNYIEAWVEFYFAEHVHYEPVKGHGPRNFEGQIASYILFGYAISTGEGWIGWYIDTKRYDLETYFWEFFEHLLRLSEETSFIVDRMGISGQELLGGLQRVSVYISNTKVEAVPFYAALIDHDYGSERLRVDRELPRYYWFIPPDELAEKVYYHEFPATLTSFEVRATRRIVKRGRR